MAQRFQHLHRRRRITIVTANTPNGSPGAAAAARSRVTVATRYPKPRPNYRNLTRVVVTPRVTGVIQPPVPGAGGTPKPLQPTWTIGTMRRKTSKNVYRPIVVQQRFVPPAKDGYSSQIVVVAPRRPAKRAVRPTLVQTVTVNIVNTPMPPRPTLVPPQGRRKRLRGLALILPGDAFEIPSPSTMQPVVVPRVNRRRTARVIIEQSVADGIPKPISFPTQAVVVARPMRTKRLRGLALVLPGDAFEMMPPTAMQPIVVPSRLKGNKGLRQAIIVSSKRHLNQYDLHPTQAVVVPYRKHPKLPPWTISTLYRKFVPPPPEHFPLPRVVVARAPRRRPQLWTRPVASQSIYQFPGNMVDKPWDLIAACIAWLRTKPNIVAAFGDVKGSTNRQKFVSDVELPKTKPPYVAFSEPIEVESYETRDGIGRRGSKIDGLFEIHVVTGEKLDARIKADAVAAELQDAPLQFTDGVLLYLRRTERRFPTFRSDGPQDQVTIYKRIIEFHYIIERYA